MLFKWTHFWDAQYQNFDSASTTATPSFQITDLFNEWTSVTKPLETRTVHKKLLHFVDLYPTEIPTHICLAQNGDLLRTLLLVKVIPKKRKCNLTTQSVVIKREPGTPSEKRIIPFLTHALTLSKYQFSALLLIHLKLFKTPWLNNYFHSSSIKIHIVYWKGNFRLTPAENQSCCITNHFFSLVNILIMIMKAHVLPFIVYCNRARFPWFLGKIMSLQQCTVYSFHSFFGWKHLILPLMIPNHWIFHICEHVQHPLHKNHKRFW